VIKILQHINQHDEILNKYIFDLPQHIHNHIESSGLYSLPDFCDGTTDMADNAKPL
jgi:hypothetical protein